MDPSSPKRGWGDLEPLMQYLAESSSIYGYFKNPSRLNQHLNPVSWSTPLGQGTKCLYTTP